MEQATIQKYTFREQVDGTMVGGFSINHMLNGNETEGMRKIEGLYVPVGLYSEKSNNSIIGGKSEHLAKITYGGTIDDEMFNNLYGQVAEHKSNARKSITKKNK
jgi:hypothetical protein